VGCFALVKAKLMALSSIHISVVSAGSEAHNKREHSMDHVYPDLIKNNESLIVKSIADVQKEVEIKCKQLSGRKLQKNAEPIREAVVNIKPETRMKDLEALATRLRQDFKIDCFQIHIHRDEGKSRNDLNHHAHMVFDYQDKQKGTVLKFNKQMLSEIQTATAEVLGMERGKSSDLTHLNAIQYKNAQEMKKVAEIALKQAEGAKELKQLESQIAEMSLKQAETTFVLKELDKLTTTLGDKAGEYIAKNSVWGVDQAKTTENISSLLFKNTRLGQELARTTIEANKVPQLEKQVSELSLKYNRYEQYVALLLLSKEKKINYEFEAKLKENPKISEIMKKSEENLRQKEPKQDQNKANQMRM
jgi:hypothetical protein